MLARHLSQRDLSAVEKPPAETPNPDTDEESVELSPQSSYIRRLQHLIAERSDLSSHSLGRDPERRVKIYKEQK